MKIHTLETENIRGYLKTNRDDEKMLYTYSWNP